MYKRLFFICGFIGVVVLMFIFYRKLELQNNITLEKLRKESYTITKNAPVDDLKGNDVSENVYEYIDKNGNLVVTNKPIGKAKKMSLPPIAVYARPMTEKDLYSDGYTSPIELQGKPDIPAIKLLHKSEIIPNINDTGRKIILTEELQHEKNALVSSTELLEYAKQNRLKNESETSYQNRLQTLADNVKAHQKNIELLIKMLN